MKKAFPLLLVALFFASLANAQEVAFNRPPQEIEELALATPTPSPVFNNDCSAVMYMWKNTALSIADVPLNRLFLARILVDPNRYCRTRTKGFYEFNKLSLKQIPNGQEVDVSGFPEGSTILHAVWNSSGNKIAIFNREDDGVYLYSASLADGKATRVTNRRINTVAGYHLLWINDDDMITTCVVEGVKAPVQGAPIGPIVQESLGVQERKRTEQGHIRSNFDLEAFNHYFTSQLTLISTSGEKEIGKPSVFHAIDLSPDCSHLIVHRVTEPSHTERFSNFKPTITIEDLEGNVVKQVKGYQNIEWRADKPATIFWTVKAEKNADYKMSVYEQDVPFIEDCRLVVRTINAFDKIYWCNDNLAFITEKENDSISISSFKPGDNNLHSIVKYDSNDLYEHPGEFVMVKNKYGRSVVWTNKKCNEVIFNSEGYSAEGNMPKLTLCKLDKEESKVIWQCKAPYYEKVIAVKNAASRHFVTSCESFEEPINFFLCDFRKGSRVAISDLPLSYPILKGVKREVMRYKRADGVELTSFVWLPVGYDAKRDGKLPVLMYAYPRTCKNAEDASRPRFSFYTHPKLEKDGRPSMLFWLTQGYCVMEDMSMPLIPTDGNKNANETFVKQLTMNAEAAIDALEAAGYGDRNRVVVGGHSYGSYMTANLLTHTKLFKAGIAFSGAFNRSLTPFGFQDENRNYWEANKLYQEMSPFNYADKLNGALLLIHGGNDENTGTYTIQSERYYQALRGHGKYVRYVELPFDGHRFFIRENILHYLYETNIWLSKYVKNAKTSGTEVNADKSMSEKSVEK